MDAPQQPAPRKWFNWRVILLLLILLAAVCASVILTDQLSPRNKTPSHPTTDSGGPRS